MDELAAAAGADPLDFRLAHLDNPRLRDVLQAAAKRFDWATRVKKKDPNIGVGLACGTEKGSYVAACAQIAIDRQQGTITVQRVCEVFECGKVLNPDNLLAQVQGCIIMGLGPALREEMRFDNGKMLNASFAGYQVPRIADLPELDIQLLDRPDLPSVGGGETPIIAIAPAIANALFHATATRSRTMPIRLPATSNKGTQLFSPSPGHPIRHPIRGRSSFPPRPVLRESDGVRVPRRGSLTNRYCSTMPNYPLLTTQITERT
jgi:isoquinoline 1-oxidoreductase